jgi:hypothetical protein
MYRPVTYGLAVIARGGFLGVIGLPQFWFPASGDSFYDNVYLPKLREVS